MQMLCSISQLHADQHLATTIQAGALRVLTHLLTSFCTFVIFHFQYLHDLDDYEVAKKKKKQQQRDCEVSRVHARRPSTCQHANWSLCSGPRSRAGTQILGMGVLTGGSPRWIRKRTNRLP